MFRKFFRGDSTGGGPWEVVMLYEVEAVEGKGESGAATALPLEAGECMRGNRGGEMDTHKSIQVTATLSAHLGILTRVQTVQRISSNETMKIKVCILVA